MRLRAPILGLILTWALTGAAVAQDDLEIEVFKPVTPGEAGIELLPAGAPGGAADFAVTARCSETKVRTAVVALRWTVGELGGGAQRVDISKLRDGFATDRYETTRRLPPELSTVGVEGPEPGINYYWRVLTELAGG